MKIICDKCGMEFDHPFGSKGRPPKYCELHRVKNRAYEKAKAAKSQVDGPSFPSVPTKRQKEGPPPTILDVGEHVTDYSSANSTTGFKNGFEMGFGFIAANLWDGEIGQAKDHPKMLSLLVQACRAADRLDRLDAMVRGGNRDWTFLKRDNKLGSEDEPVYRVVVNGLFRDERETAMVLKNLIGEMRALQSIAPQGKPNESDSPKPTETPVNPIDALVVEDELAVRRATATSEHSA